MQQLTSFWFFSHVGFTNVVFLAVLIFGVSPAVSSSMTGGQTLNDSSWSSTVFLLFVFGLLRIAYVIVEVTRTTGTKDTKEVQRVGKQPDSA